MEKLNRSFGNTVKSLDETEKSIVHVITDSTIDRHGEIVDPNGMDAKNFQKNPVVLFGHNTGGWGITDVSTIPIIGRSAWLKRDGEAWISKTIFSDATQFSRDAWALAKDGLLPAVSIGFMPLGDPEPKQIAELDLSPSNKGDFDPKHMVDVYRKWELFEYSLVPIPANPNAVQRSAINKALEVVKSSEMLGLLNGAFLLKRVEELESLNLESKIEEAIQKHLESFQSNDERAWLKVKDYITEEIKKQLEPKAENVATLSSDDLVRLVKENVRGAFSSLRGRIDN